MIIVDNALRARAEAGNPIRVGIAGAGFMGHAISRQISHHVAGMEVVAIANRTLEKAAGAFTGAGRPDPQLVNNAASLDAAIAKRRPAITDDPTLFGQASSIDVIIEATGTIEPAAHAAFAALKGGKHLILCNAELDGTLGPILKTYAKRAGVILSDIDGDQPGAELNLYRYVQGIGLEPLLCGNIKGLMDHYRTPTTQAGFAQRWGQDPRMVTNFADGSKISFEQALVANATGMRVAARGMRGLTYQGMVDDAAHLAMYNVSELRALGGLVDYTLGASPGPGVFVLAAQPQQDTQRARDLAMYKMGEGPLYCFYTPFHLCYFEVPMTVARAVLFDDATVTPLAGPVVEVIATAKRDLKVGEILDGIGGYTLYGQCENSDTARSHDLLPIGLAEGCCVRREIKKDEALQLSDVERPLGRLCDALWFEQTNTFRTAGNRAAHAS